MSTPPLPVPDQDSEPFWAALRQHQLRIQRCVDCGRRRFPPRSFCNQCASTASSWEPCSGRGHLVSWIVSHRAFGPSFSQQVPYPVLLVALEEQEDIQLYGNWRGPTEALAIGLSLQAVFEDVTPDVTLLQWQPSPAL